jgi:hypothetical protein
MKKTTLFVSAALTTFMLAIMFGVASAYQKVVQTAGAKDVTAQTQVLSTEAGKPTMAVTTNSGMTIEQAANLASNVIGNSEVYSAEVTQLDGVDAYLVTFSSGDLVYIGMDGKVISISKMPVNYVINQTTSHSSSGNESNYNSNGNSNDNNSNYNNNGNSNYNSNDEHDDHGNENEHESGGDD